MQKTEWKNEFENEYLSGKFAKFPNETMLKILFGNYLKKPLHLDRNSKILDIGCAFGNNLIPFADIGCEIYGIDIHSKIGSLAERFLGSKGYKNFTFKEGNNREINFGDNSFDLVISINTIHYENNERNICKAFEEISRVLKPGGYLYLCTVGKKHSIYKRSIKKSENIFEINNFGFRSGEKFFFFNNKKTLKKYLSKNFKNIEFGQVTENLMTLPLDFIVSVGKNK
tara:strand:- start:33 stop:713 length:681 start_codon:yes stop_codon:yes gene_type:complete